MSRPATAVAAATAAVAPPKDKTHAWSVAIFERERVHLTTFVNQEIIPRLDDPVCQLLVVFAPVKSGKREIAEYAAMKDKSETPNRVHCFLTAWVRVADKDQRDEMALHNLKVFAINRKTEVEACKNWIRKMLNAGKTIVVHIDECDYGAGEKQILGEIYTYLKTKERIFKILYSATPEEVLFSGDMHNDGQQELIDDMYMEAESVKYKPLSTYCGAEKFLDEGLVFEAMPFIMEGDDDTIALSEQVKTILRECEAAMVAGSRRNIIIVRLTTKEGKQKEDKLFYKFTQIAHEFPELEPWDIIADKDDIDPSLKSDKIDLQKIEWSNQRYFRRINPEIPTLIIHDQTAGRSTEWACHDRVYATHDYRKTVQYNTVAQAQLRVAHYYDPSGRGKYKEFQPIRVYGNVATFQLAAGRITHDVFLNPVWQKRKLRRTPDMSPDAEDLYEVRNKTTRERHPSWPDALTMAAADIVLMELGCNKDMLLSARIAGNMMQVPVVATEFIPCDDDSWEEAIENAKTVVLDNEFDHWNPRNPFRESARLSHGIDGRCPESGLELGHIRGEYEVWDYASIKESPGWGVTDTTPRQIICYDGDELGVALCWRTGDVRTINRLSAYKSMYTPKPRE